MTSIQPELSGFWGPKEYWEVDIPIVNIHVKDYRADVR